MDQVYRSITTCINKTDWMTKFQNDLSASIKQSAESQSVALLGALGNSNSEVETNIRNSVKNAVNVTTMTNLVNNMKQAQTVYVDGVGNTLLNVSMRQISDNIASSTQELVGSIDVINKIAAVADQKAKSTQQDPIANLLKGLSELFTGPLMWIAIMLIGGLIVFVVFLNSGAGSALMDQGFQQLDNYQGNYADDQYQNGQDYQYEQAPTAPAPTVPTFVPPVAPTTPAPTVPTFVPTTAAPTVPTFVPTTAAPTVPTFVPTAPAPTVPVTEATPTPTPESYGPVNLFENQAPPPSVDLFTARPEPMPTFNEPGAPTENRSDDAYELQTLKFN